MLAGEVQIGMQVKYYDNESRQYELTRVIDAGSYINEYGEESHFVIIDNPFLTGSKFTVSPSELKHADKGEMEIEKLRVTHCIGHKCNEILDSKSMDICEKCNGIICPKCMNCLCNYGKY